MLCHVKSEGAKGTEAEVRKARNNLSPTPWRRQVVSLFTSVHLAQGCQLSRRQWEVRSKRSWHVLQSERTRKEAGVKWRRTPETTLRNLDVLLRVFYGEEANG